MSYASDMPKPMPYPPTAYMNTEQYEEYWRRFDMEKEYNGKPSHERQLEISADVRRDIPGPSGPFQFATGHIDLMLDESNDVELDQYIDPEDEKFKQQLNDIILKGK